MATQFVFNPLTGQFDLINVDSGSNGAIIEGGSAISVISGFAYIDGGSVASVYTGYGDIDGGNA